MDDSSREAIRPAKGGDSVFMIDAEKLFESLAEEIAQIEREGKTLIFETKYDVSTKLVNAMENAIADIGVVEVEE